MRRRVARLHAVLSVDDDGNEALCMQPDGEGGLVPLLAADDDRRDDIWRRGQQIARSTGRTMRLVSFDDRRDEAVILP